MAGSAFDLDAFAPAGVTIKVRGVEFRIDGDPDVDVVARMLRIESAIDEAGKEGALDAIVAAVQEAKHLISELILAVDDTQDVSRLKLNAQDVMTLFALVMHGGSVATAIAQAISRPTEPGADADTPVATPGNGNDEDHEDADVAPLVSASISSGRSSSLDGTGDGLPATGTG